VYEVKDEKALRLYKSASNDLPKFKRDIVRSKAMVMIEDHEMESLFEYPNTMQSWAGFIEQVLGYELTTGNSYIHAIGPTNGPNAGLVKEMWVLPSPIVNIVAGDKTNPVLRYEMKGDPGVKIPAEEVMHLKYWTPNWEAGKMLYGVSPLQAGRRVVSKSNASYDSSVSSFQNMGAYGFLSADTVKEAEPLTEEQAEMIEQRLAKKTGPHNRGKTLVTSASLKWQQMGMSPADLNIIESDKMDLRTICMLYHVPSELFGDAANKTYANTKEAGSAVYTNAVIPSLVQFRDAFNKFIYPRYQGKIFVDFDTSMISELQDDLTQLTAALSGAWWITPNEKRDLMSFAMDESNPMMSEYWVPLGATPMSSVTVNDTALEEAAKMMGILDYVKR
jgi:HK97 family phage portal protein